MTTPAQWRSDRVAWNLTDAEYRHYLRRLSEYHMRLYDHYNARYAYFSAKAARLGRWARILLIANVVLLAFSILLGALR